MKKTFFFIFLTIVSYSCIPTNQEISNKPPNIVMILTDDQGWGDLSSNGNLNLNTPNIDQLGSDGAVFERFFVSAVCSPTRAEILTGRYAVRGGVYSTSAGGERLDLDETTIADVFQQNGYSTGAFGKWHNGMQYPYHPNGRGFEEFYGFCSGHWGNYFSPVLEHNGQLVQGNGFLPDDLTDKAMDFIELNKETPFFVYIPYNTPHSPMQAKDEDWERFKDKELDADHRFSAKEQIEHSKAAYAMTENIDWNVGRIQKKLKELNLEENTIVLFMSDNGPNGWRYNGDMKGIKGHVDEGGVRSPLAIQWKGQISPGKRIESITSAMDLLPTLVDMAGLSLDLPKPIDGISLKSLLLSDQTEWVDRILVNHWNEKTSIRSERFRLGPDNQLFDMQSDPSQTADVALQFPEDFERLKAYKTSWKKEVLTELPDHDSRPFLIGHPDYKYNQIPARDGIAHGTIKRSNKWPNCSYFTNWTAVEDKITWDAEVVTSGKYKVEVYYTCGEENIGANMELSYGDSKAVRKIEIAHDPPEFGHEKDRFTRIESYVKDFIPLDMGEIYLEKGSGTLTLKALNIPGEAAMEFRMLLLTSVE